MLQTLARPPAVARALPPSVAHERDPAALVRAAAAGDPVAFDRLVARYDRALRSVARSYRLNESDADDVVQITWLQFVQHGHRLRDPAAVIGWLMTTARRQCVRMLQRHVRELPTDDPARDESGDHTEPDRDLLADELRGAVQGALAELPERQRELLRLLVANPELSYEEVGRRLAMPVGSIGPTRARALERLRCNRGLQALQAATA
jgi:RNA polymerase sigma factor (sigma-70 family)